MELFCLGLGLVTFKELVRWDYKVRLRVRVKVKVKVKVRVTVGVTIQDKARQAKTNQSEVREDKSSQVKTIQGKVRVRVRPSLG